MIVSTSKMKWETTVWNPGLTLPVTAMISLESCSGEYPEFPAFIYSVSSWTRPHLTISDDALAFTA